MNDLTAEELEQQRSAWEEMGNQLYNRLRELDNELRDVTDRRTQVHMIYEQVIYKLREIDEYLPSSAESV